MCLLDGMSDSRGLPSRVHWTDHLFAGSYWSHAVLGHLQRKMALQLFTLGDAPDASSNKLTLEKALTAFDMCILEDREGDFDEVCNSYSKPLLIPGEH